MAEFDLQAIVNLNIKGASKALASLDKQFSGLESTIEITGHSIDAVAGKISTLNKIKPVEKATISSYRSLASAMQALSKGLTTVANAPDASRSFSKLGVTGAAALDKIDTKAITLWLSLDELQKKTKALNLAFTHLGTSSGKQMNNLALGTRGLTKGMASVSQSLGAVGKEFSGLTAKQQTLISATKSTAASLNQVSSAANRAAQSVNNVSTASSRAASNMGRIRGASGGAFSSIGGMLGNIAGNLNPLKLMGGVLTNIGLTIFRIMTYDAWRLFNQGIQAAISNSMEFQAALRDMNGLVRLNESGLRDLGENLRTSSSRLGFATDPSEMARSIKEAYALGVEDPEVGLAIAEQSARLAKAASISQEKATTLLASSMNAFGGEVKDAARFVDILLNATIMGATDMDKLAMSMGRVAPLAAKAGSSFEETVAMIGIGTRGGTRTTTVVAGLAHTYSALTSQTQKTSAALEKYGLRIDSSTIKSKGMANTLAEMQERAAAYGDEIGIIGNIIGQTEATNAIMAIGADKDILAKGVATIGDNAGTAKGSVQTVLDSQTKAAKDQYELFMANLNAAGIGIGDNLDKVLHDLFARLNGELKPEMETLFETMSDIMQTFVKALGSSDLAGVIKNLNYSLTVFNALIAPLAGFGKILFAVGKILGNIPQLFLRAGAVFAEMIAAAVEQAFNGLFGTKSNFLTRTAQQGVNDLLGDVKDIGDGFSAIGDVLVDGWNEVGNAFDGTNDKLIAHRDLMHENQKLLGGYKDELTKVPSMWNDVNKAAANTGRDFTSEAHNAKSFDDIPLTSALPKAPAPKVDLEAELFGRGPKEPSALSKGWAATYLADWGKKLGSKTISGFSPDIENMFNKKEAAPEAPPKHVFKDFKQADTNVDRDLELGKITPKEALATYSQLLIEAKQIDKISGKTRGSADDIFRIEKSILLVKKEQGRLAAAAAKEAEREARRKKKVTDEIRAERIRNTQGERAGDMEKLNQDKAAKLADGADSGEVNAWYNSERGRVTKEHDEKDKKKAREALEKEVSKNEDTFKIDADIKKMNNDILGSRMAELDAEVERMRLSEVEQTKIKEYYAARRAQIEKETLQEVEEARMALLDKTVANEAATLEAKGETSRSQEAVWEQENAARFLEISKTVEDAKKAGLSKVDIDRYVASERLRILQESKAKEKAIEEAAEAPKSVSGQANDPRMLMEDAFNSGGVNFSGVNFGATKGGKAGDGMTSRSRAKKAAKDAALAAKLATIDTDPASGIVKGSSSPLGGTGTTPSGLEEERKDTLEIIVKQDTGSGTKSVYQNKVGGSGTATSPMEAQLGCFPVK